MLDAQTHEVLMKRILRDIYQDTSLQSQLVFKGGTCCEKIHQYVQKLSPSK